MRRRDDRAVPLEELLEEFMRQRPPGDDIAAYEEWRTRIFQAAADAGYSALEVFRAMRPRPAPSKKRSP